MKNRTKRKSRTELVQLGDRATSEAALHTSRKLRAIISALDKTKPTFARDLAFRSQQLGDALVTMGDHASALAEYQVALAYFDNALPTTPQDLNSFSEYVWVRDSSARTLSKIGDIHVVEGQLGAAVRSFSRALVLMERIIEESLGTLTPREAPTDEWRTGRLVNDLPDYVSLALKIGSAHVAQNMLAQVVKDQSSTVRFLLSVQERLDELNKLPGMFCWPTIAEVQCGFGMLLVKADRSKAAIGLFQSAIRCLTPFFEDDYVSRRVVGALSLNYCKLGEAQWSMRRRDAAETSFERSLLFARFLAEVSPEKTLTWSVSPEEVQSNLAKLRAEFPKQQGDARTRAASETNLTVDTDQKLFVAFRAPSGHEATVTKHPHATIEAIFRRLFEYEGTPPSQRKGIESEFRERLARAKYEVLDSPIADLRPPVRSLTTQEVKALVAFGRGRTYAKRPKNDRRTPFEWVRDEYSRWYPGVLMHHLLNADEGLWRLLHKRRSRARKGQGKIPDWFDVPSEEENQYRAATPEERKRIDTARAVYRGDKTKKNALG